MLPVQTSKSRRREAGASGICICTCVLHAFVVITGGEKLWRIPDEDSHVSCLTGQAKVATTLVGDEDGESF